MTAREALGQILDELPDERLDQLLDYARYLAVQDEQREWQEFGRMQLAKAYGDSEPEYTEVDVQRDATQ